MTLHTPPPLTADELNAPHEAPPADDPIIGAVGGQPEAAPADAPGLPIGPDEVAAFLAATGDVITTITRHEHWRIEPGEVALPSAAIARQLAKPDTAFAAWLAEHADAVLITVGLGIVFVPRALIEWQWIRYEREQRASERAAEQAEVPHYGYEPEPGAPRDDREAEAGARGGVPVGGSEGAAVGAPTDPERLAAAVGSVIGG